MALPCRQPLQGSSLQLLGLLAQSGDLQFLLGEFQFELFSLVGELKGNDLAGLASDFQRECLFSLLELAIPG
ncbi:MAG TPA: hypothetical protein VGI19_08335 [Candidatus Cybelea sp.]